MLARVVSISAVLAPLGAPHAVNAQAIPGAQAESSAALARRDWPAYERLRIQLDHLCLTSNDIQALDALMSQKDWLGTAEKIVFDAFRIYNITPAHADDICAAIIENPDLEVITPAGGERRKADTIGVNDIIEVKTQRSFLPMFLDAGTKGGSKK